MLLVGVVIIIGHGTWGMVGKLGLLNGWDDPVWRRRYKKLGRATDGATDDDDDSRAPPPPRAAHAPRAADDGDDDAAGALGRSAPSRDGVPSRVVSLPPEALVVDAPGGAPGGAAHNARFSEAFGLIDRDGDGLLSRAEIILACRADSAVRELLGLPSHGGVYWGPSVDAFEALFQVSHRAGPSGAARRPEGSARRVWGGGGRRQAVIGGRRRWEVVGGV